MVRIVYYIGFYMVTIISCYCLVGLGVEFIIRKVKKPDGQKGSKLFIDFKFDGENEKGRLLSARVDKLVKDIQLLGWETSLGEILGIIMIVAGGGFLVGCFLHSMLIGTILSIALYALACVFIKVKIMEMKRRINDNLPMVLGNIIAQYMGEEAFVIAVEKKLTQIPKPLDRNFSMFVNQVNLLNVDVVTALEKLKTTVDNYYFQEFIELAIQTEIQGEKLKYTMLTIPEDMRCLAQVQEEFDLVRKKYNREFVACLIFLPINVLVLKVGYERYFNLLFSSWIGRSGVALLLIIIVTCICMIIKYNREIKVEFE